MPLCTQLFILWWCIHRLAVPTIQELVQKKCTCLPGLSLAVPMSFSEDPAPRLLPPAMPASVRLTHSWTFSLFWMPTLLYWFASRSGCVSCSGRWNANRIDVCHVQVGTGEGKWKSVFLPLSQKQKTRGWKSCLLQSLRKRRWHKESPQSSPPLENLQKREINLCF